MTSLQTIITNSSDWTFLENRAENVVACSLKNNKQRILNIPFALWMQALDPKQEKSVRVTLYRFSKEFTNNALPRIQAVAGILSPRTGRRNEVTDVDLSNIIQRASASVSREAGEFVFVLGGTRSGKSALINWLAGRTKVLVDKKDVSTMHALPNEKVMEFINPVAEVGHDESMTHSIHKVQIQEGLILSDAPGFNDSLGPIKELENGLLISMAAERLSGVLFCVKYSDLADFDTAKKFVESLKELQHFLSKNMDGYLPAISLVITRLPGNQKREDLLEAIPPLIRDFLESENLVRKDEELWSFRRKLLDSGIVNRIILGTLEEPDREEMLNKIQTLRPSSPQRFPFGIPLSPDAKRTLLSLMQERLASGRVLLNNFREILTKHWTSQADDPSPPVEQFEKLKEEAEKSIPVTIDELKQESRFPSACATARIVFWEHFEAIKKLNGLLSESERLKIEENYTDSLRGIQDDLKNIVLVLAAKRRRRIREATLESLEFALGSYEVQKNVKELQARLKPATDILSNILVRLPKEISDNVSYLNVVIREKIFDNELEEAAFIAVLNNYIFSPYKTNLHGSVLKVEMNASKMALSTLVHMLDFRNVETIEFHGKHLYFDLHLEGEGYMNKSLFFNVPVEVKKECRIRLSASSLNNSASILFCAPIHGTLKPSGGNQEWTLNTQENSTMTIPSWGWSWSC